MTGETQPFGTDRLTEQLDGLRRQIDRLESALIEQARTISLLIRDSEDRVTALTDAKFVTYRTLIDSQADKVRLALDATEKAIGKAEVATSKAIDKESQANADRFAAVNEFRAQLSDLMRGFLPRSEAQAVTDRYIERIDGLNNRITRIESVQQGAAGNRSGLYAALGATTAIIIAVVVVINLVLTQ